MYSCGHLTMPRNLTAILLRSIAESEGGRYSQLGKMKKLIIFGFLVIPVFVSAYRQGEPTDFSKKLIQAAIERTKHIVRYDGSYRKIIYPNDDVLDSVGVCTDVVIRSYRKLGIDLQKDIHEDMKENFNKYPKLWGLSKRAMKERERERDLKRYKRAKTSKRPAKERRREIKRKRGRENNRSTHAQTRPSRLSTQCTLPIISEARSPKWCGFINGATSLVRLEKAPSMVCERGRKM